jgi:predicted P-loop ATPase
MQHLKNADTVPTAENWESHLTVDRKGRPKNTAANIKLILLHDEEMRGVVGFDEFRSREVYCRCPPWQTIEQYDGAPTQQALTDADDVSVQGWLGSRYQITPSLDAVNRGVTAAAQQNRFHPLRAELNGAAELWDGQPRVETWLTTYAGAPDTPLTREIGRMFIVSLIARVMQPGSKVDHVLVAEGPQGIGKSSLLRALAGAEYFTDELAPLDSKDAALACAGVLLIELPELTALKRSDANTAKKFISMRVDRLRPPYGRRVIEVPRQCVFCATTNDSGYLKDDSGNRRFWPVQFRRCDVAAMERDRTQLLGEAVALFRKGVPWWPTEDSLVEQLRVEQANRLVEDPWVPVITAYLHERANPSQPLRTVGLPAQPPRAPGPLTSEELLDRAIQIPAHARQRGDAIRLTGLMKTLGYVSVRMSIRGVRQMTWREE